MPSYSLWLQPESGPLQQSLQKEINHLASAHQGPRFEPHVTLIPGFEAGNDDAAIRAAQMVAENLSVYDINFGPSSYGKIFFQCVYILCEKTEAVMKANELASHELGIQSTSTYMPHLSLLYGNISEDKRKIIAADIQKRLLDVKEIESGFEVKSITLWSTEPGDTALKSWKKLTEIEL